MTLDGIKKRIESYLASNKRWPVIVDFSNKADMKDFIYHFSVGTNNILSAGKFCGKDETIKLEELSNTIENNSKNVILVHLSVYLKLQGETVLKNTLKSIISKSIMGHVVIVTYQCRNFLKFSDSRFSERAQIFISDGEFDEAPNICFISPTLEGAFLSAYQGFEKVGEAFETSNENRVYVATAIKKEIFYMSVVNVSQLSNAYDILCSKDTRIKNVPERFGEPQQWNGLLKQMEKYDFSVVVETQFGPMGGLIQYVRNYPSFSADRKWMYYIALSVLGTKKNTYLSHAISNAANYIEFPKALFRSILTIEPNDEEFKQLYEERKDIIKSYVTYLNETVDYCKIVSAKQEDAIYYLTDLTQPEKEKAIEWLDTYGSKYTSNELISILNTVYPDLAAYLCRYRFKKELLNNYFECYKYQKVINRVLPSFEVNVEEQAIELGFVSALPSRTQLFDKIDLKGAHAYFFDALGVEYLGFIQTKCNEYGLTASILCGRCELPSLTCYNKDFVEVCKEKECPISDIKELDEIKHHGEDNFDYEKMKTPVYLIKELEIIDELLKKVQVAILNNQYDKAVIVSDHGASRLAVLHDSENIWQMETDGVHSGRCCPMNEINTKPSFAVEKSGYWVLANYDRFKGSRKANVEVHGGATLEEVAVPIIEITRKIDGIEAIILDKYRTVTLSALEVPVLKIYVGVFSNDIKFKINDNYYDAVPTSEKYIYEVNIPECSKKGIYSADILNGAEVLSVNNVFEVKKKGMTEVSLFD
jgi:hypothetical protein